MKYRGKVNEVQGLNKDSGRIRKPQNRITMEIGGCRHLESVDYTISK